MFGFGKKKKQTNVTEQVRRFESAILDRLTSSWSITPQSIDQDLLNDTIALVARARNLAQNSDYARRYLQMVKNNVVGPDGIELVSEPRFPDGTLDHAAGEAIESDFKRWGKKGNCDITGQWSWVDIQGLTARALKRDGEAIIVKYPNWAGNEWRYALQFVDNLQLDVNLNKKLDGGTEIVMGVEVNEARRPVRYHFLQDTKSPQMGTPYVGNKHTSIEADRVIHVYTPEYAHQTRGFSAMVSSMKRLQMLDKYEEAALTASRVAAAYGAVITRNPGNEGYNGNVQQVGGEREISVEPGTILDLPYEATMHQFKPEQPTTTMPAAIKAWLRGIASGWGVSYNSLSNDMEGVNYSSLRTAVIDDRDQWRADQTFLSEHLCSPVFEQYLTNALLLKLIKIKSRALSPMRFDKFSCCTWQGRGWQWVDPAKDQKANSEGIADRTVSPFDVIRQTGKRPRKVVEDHARWQELLQLHGLKPQAERMPEPDKTPDDNDDDGGDDEED